jgi:hypothetical protein
MMASNCNVANLSAVHNGSLLNLSDGGTDAFRGTGVLPSEYRERAGGGLAQ